jgi:hypothetical protein
MEMQDLPIAAEECWKLLASGSMGRIALSLHALPVILPVQYYLDGPVIVVCFGRREIPEQSLDAVIAFTADEIDPVSRAGWSVQVVGRATVPRRLGLPLPCGWPAAGQIIRIEPGTVTGFRLRLCPLTGSSRAPGHGH